MSTSFLYHAFGLQGYDYVRHKNVQHAAHPKVTAKSAEGKLSEKTAQQNTCSLPACLIPFGRSLHLRPWARNRSQRVYETLTSPGQSEATRPFRHGLCNYVSIQAEISGHGLHRVA
jgi:hypothetical protein